MLEFVCSYSLFYCSGFLCIKRELVAVIYRTTGRVRAFHMSHIDDNTSVYKAEIGIFQKRLAKNRKGTAAFGRLGTVDNAVVGV